MSDIATQVREVIDDDTPLADRSEPCPSAK